MIPVLSVCGKDADLAVRLLQWCADLDGKDSLLNLIVVAENGVDLTAVEKAASALACNGVIKRYEPWTGNKTWPWPQNYAWQTVAREIMPTLGQPWFWWEPDVTPLCKGWWQALCDEYTKGGKPFMGHVVPGHGHMNGAAFYPADVSKHCISGLLVHDVPFDSAMRREIANKVHPANHLMGHYVKPKNREGITKWDGSIDLGELVTYHGCTDGSLMESLRKPSLVEKSTAWLSDVSKKLGWAVRPKPVVLPILKIRCLLDDNSGYGNFSLNLVTELVKREGFSLSIYIIGGKFYSACNAELDLRLKSCIVDKIVSKSVLIYTLVYQTVEVQSVPDMAFFTMWETTRIPEKIVANLNSSRVVIVPCGWNASVFSSCGVTAPIRIVPLGINMDLYPETPLPVNSSGVLTFCTAARFMGGGIRKGSELVISSFKKAFPKQKDVRLHVKAFGDCPVKKDDDPRIVIAREYWPKDKLIQWYQDGDVFVSGSASEGWGLHQQEAMSCGRPVIGVNFGGVTEFWNPTNGYSVSYTLIKAQGIYNGLGDYACLNEDSMVEQMRLAYDDQDLLREKSKLSAKAARKYSIQHCADRFLSVMKEFGYL